MAPTHKTRGGRVAQISLPLHLIGETFYELFTYLLQDYELIPISIFRTATYNRKTGSSIEMKSTTQYPITAPPPGLVLEKTDLVFVVGPELKLHEILKLYSPE